MSSYANEARNKQLIFGITGILNYNQRSSSGVFFHEKGKL